jgi:hypothetical protein
MKITKQHLKQIIKEEYINEISPQTKTDPGGFKGIISMAEQASNAAENLETKLLHASNNAQGALFQDDPDGDLPEEIYIIKRFIESIKKAAMWGIGSGTVPLAMSQMGPEEEKRQRQRLHTPGYKRDDLGE